MTTLTDELLAGMVGGIAGSAVMSMAMMMGEQTGLMKTPPPLKVERSLEERFGVEEKTSIAQEQALSQLMHFATGALLGAGYGAVHSATGGEPMLTGPLYGLGVYALNYLGIMPAIDMSMTPTHQRPRDAGLTAMMHLVYGAVTAAVAERLLEEIDRSEFPLPQHSTPMTPEEEAFFQELYGEAVLAEEEHPSRENLRYRGVM